MRKFCAFLAMIMTWLIMIAVGVTIVDIHVSDVHFFEKEYLLMDTSREIKMSQSDLSSVTQELIDYLHGEKLELNVKAKVAGKKRTIFTKRERQHMVDVKALYQNALLVRNIAAIAALILFGLCMLLVRHERLHFFAKAINVSLAIIGCIILAIALWMLIDFDSFWTQFHLIFFRNDLWMLDPAESVMIQMFPLQFWLALCKSIAIQFVGIFAALGVACTVFLAIRNNRKKTLLALPDDNNMNEPVEKGE